MNLEYLLQAQRAYFHTGTTKRLSFRKKQLTRLYQALKENEPAIFQALYMDLNKSKQEAFMTEISIVYQEIKYALTHLSEWTRPHLVKTPLSHFLGKSYTLQEPYGVVLVLAPWNYPFQLAIAPLIGAIAAGNCVILKASKNSPATTNILQKIIKSTFSPNYIYCMNHKIAYEVILRQRYDYIFFTGSERVGKIVMRAASEFVTPISLELGGKSPCIVDETANLKLAAKRIVWGKMLNAGQTCVAPDYIVVHESKKKELIQKILQELLQRYPDPLFNPLYPAIINEYHFKRLTGFIDREMQKTTNDYDISKRKIAPTVFTAVTFESEIMKEEIFGPIFPVIGYDDLQMLLEQLQLFPKPLACYIFSERKATCQTILQQLSFGGACINDTVMHTANHYLPFGGIGSSGMGQYHGSYSFETFSHKKGVLQTSTKFDMALRYAPFSDKKLAIIKMIFGESDH